MNIINENLQFAYSSGIRKYTTDIIIHHAAGSGTVQQIHALHLKNGWAGIAYHFYVRRDGKIYEGRPLTWNGGHTTNWNYCSVGVCFEGNFESEAMSHEQEVSGRELIHYLRGIYPTARIGKHKDYQATACPGKNFPFDEVVYGNHTEDTNTDAENTNKPSKYTEISREWALLEGLIKGNSDGGIGWTEPITKEQLIEVLYRFYITFIPNL